MINRESLIAIPNLNIVGKADKWTKEQLNDYIRALDSFVEHFPPQEELIKKALEKRDYEAFSKCHTVVYDMLVRINADDLAKECRESIEKLRDMQEDKLEAYSAYFISSLSMLSIDIQMALERGGEDGDPVVVQELPAAVHADSPEGYKGLILAVDDRSIFLNMMKNYLQGSEYKLTCVTSGLAALRFLKDHQPSLFILDIEMPEMDGIELSEKIQAMGHTAPIIFLTGNSTRDNVARALKAGAADFVVKPINQKLLLERIAKYLG